MYADTMPYTMEELNGGFCIKIERKCKQADKRFGVTWCYPVRAIEKELSFMYWGKLWLSRLR